MVYASIPIQIITIAARKAPVRPTTMTAITKEKLAKKAIARAESVK